MEGKQINLNTILLILIVPTLVYLGAGFHALDVRLSRIEQQIIDGQNWKQH